MDAHLLALETSSRLCEVALLSSMRGQIDVRCVSHDGQGDHAERLLPMADQLLAQAGLGRDCHEGVAFGQGPGGFTGLRVACGVAQGIAMALNIPVVPVGSLQAAAARDVWAGGDVDGQPVRVLIQDARMDEVYLGAYRHTPRSDPVDEDWQVVQAPVLLGKADVGVWLRRFRPGWRDTRGRLSPVRLLGDALDAYPELRDLAATPDLEDVQIGAAWRPSAEAVARLGLDAWRRRRAVTPDLAAPLYVRDRVAYTTAERGRGLGGNPRAVALPDIAVEAMTSAHLDEVVAIERAVQSFPWTRRNFQDALESGYGAWVARRGGAVVGFFLTMYAPDVAHLLLIGVAPDAQREGVGTCLLRHCEHESLAHGLDRVILEVRPSNRKALAFYDRHGYAEMSRRKDYYPTGRPEREDALVLEKNLAETAPDHD
jgi:tRNA threonylcarbamoyladenosine biosynthesis protein TsaB